MARPRPDARLPGIERTRQQVLSHPLARGISPDEVRDFLAKVPHNRFPRVAYGKRGTAPCIQPRGGFPAVEKQQRLTRQLRDAGGGFIPRTVDSYTRHTHYGTSGQLL